MSALSDTAIDPKTDIDPLSSTQAFDPSGDVSLGVTLAAPLPKVSSTSGITGIDIAVTGQIALNSSVLPRVAVEGDAVILSSSQGPRYAQLRELGKGGMGEVDLVEDRDIGRPVAMKRLLAGQVGPAAVARFVDEVRTIGRLEHPNIVPIHDVGIDEQGRFFFVMKYVDGETLESILEKLLAGDPDAVRRYDIPRRVQIFVQILRALQFAHERGIIHRDLKPANVMVGRFGEVVLMDWGVARTIAGRDKTADLAALPADPARTGIPGQSAAPSRASTTRVGALIGTPLYMSPEQARGANDQLDQRSDLYSAALLFHEMLGLRHLRAEHKTLASLLHASQTEDPPGASGMFASSPQKGVGAEYAHFLHQGLQREPSARFQSANEMLEDLHLILAGRFKIQCPVTLMKRGSLAMGQLVDRSPPAAMWLGIGAVILFAALLANAIRDLVG